MRIGYIKEIVRHPIKSLGGESVPQTKVMKYGIYGDRGHAYFDETIQDFLTITNFPEMVRYKAKYVGEESMDDYPQVQVLSPEGKIYDWQDEEFRNLLEQKSKRKITTREFPPAHIPIGPIAVEPILLATDASLERLEELWGKEEVDARRFRPNIMISLEEKVPFIEEQWLGRRIKIGPEVELKFVGHCKRCMIITVHPENAKRDASLHKTLIKENNNHFGIYASVIKTGDIQVGDDIYFLDSL